MTKRRVTALLLSGILAISLAGCGGSGKPSATQPAKGTPAASAPAATGTSKLPADGPKFNLSIATSAAEGSIVDLTMKYAEKILEERSGGKITADLFPAAQLGSDRELIEGCQIGNVSMVMGATSPQVSFVPALAVFDLPNAFPSLEVAKKVLADYQGNIEGKYAEKNLKLLNIYPFLYRYMSSNKEVNKVEDFAGIKIRTMENPYHLAYWKSLGANPTPLAFSELYIALQQKLVDAQENPLDVILSSKVYEQQKYIINTKHIVFVTSIIMNQDIWKKMPKEYQALMTECFNEARDYATSISIKKEAEFRAQLEGKGVKFIDLSDSVLAEMAKKAQPVYESIRKDVGANSVDALLQAIEKAKK